MSTTSTTDPSIIHAEVVEQKEGLIVLTLPTTDYRIQLATDKPLDVQPKQRVTGRVHAEAMRVDIASSGGRFIEPVYGRPRRVQGRIVATDAENNTITVRAACPVICTLGVGQTAGQFNLGDIATFDVRKGATFTLIP